MRIFKSICTLSSIILIVNNSYASCRDIAEKQLSEYQEQNKTTKIPLKLKILEGTFSPGLILSFTGGLQVTQPSSLFVEGGFANYSLAAAGLGVGFMVPALALLSTASYANNELNKRVKRNEAIQNYTNGLEQIIHLTKEFENGDGENVRRLMSISNSIIKDINQGPLKIQELSVTEISDALHLFNETEEMCLDSNANGTVYLVKDKNLVSYALKKLRNIDADL